MDWRNDSKKSLDVANDEFRQVSMMDVTGRVLLIDKLCSPDKIIVFSIDGKRLIIEVFQMNEDIVKVIAKTILLNEEYIEITRLNKTKYVAKGTTENNIYVIHTTQHDIKLLRCIQFEGISIGKIQPVGGNYFIIEEGFQRLSVYSSNTCKLIKFIRIEQPWSIFESINNTEIVVKQNGYLFAVDIFSARQRKLQAYDVNKRILQLSHGYLFSCIQSQDDVEVFLFRLKDGNIENSEKKEKIHKDTTLSVVIPNVRQIYKAKIFREQPSQEDYLILETQDLDRKALCTFYKVSEDGLQEGSRYDFAGLESAIFNFMNADKPEVYLFVILKEQPSNQYCIQINKLSER